VDNTGTASTLAVKYEITVQENGRIEISVPFLPGKKVVVFVIQEENEQDMVTDLVNAAESSLDFWDNPYDDEDWNNIAWRP
jgi:hypothetical protein